MSLSSLMLVSEGGWEGGKEGGRKEGRESELASPRSLFMRLSSLLLLCVRACGTERVY
jgi:hypothetical protein